MGLFDMFKGDSGQEMTPPLALTISMLYMIGADGEIANEEIGQLLAVIGGADSNGAIGVGGNNQAMLDKAIKYWKSKNTEQFFTEATPILSDAQRMCILANICDSLLSDGTAARQEQELFNKFLKAFDVSEERFRPFFEVISLKNDRAVFRNANHPKNQAGYKVNLSK